MSNSILYGFMGTWLSSLSLICSETVMKDINTEPNKVGTTEAAFLLNISTARLRLLLRQGRLKGAEKVERFWVIPLNSRGMPEITPGRRGPQGTWNKGFRTGNTFIHVLRKEIDYNRDHGTSLPAISVKQGNRNDYCHEVEILGNCKIIYRPHKPNRSQAGGARLWIETEPDVEIIRKFFRDTKLDENKPQGSS
ncbi:DNA-binding protein [Okeania sp. SIO3I5]|uniref:DNA-binding protein n=1 Tax=Okeania sp. SIO3I5 TaxID=2607805 RepID=UPI0025F0AABE|nr:DNA-binding protein [Okeania sp. SIO3I5]